MTPPGAPAERHDEQAVGRADREQVEDHRLERQQQRAERAHEHQVGDGEHAEHEPGEDAVGAIDEVDAGRRAAARVHARAAEAAPPGRSVRGSGARASWPDRCRSRGASRRRCARSGRSGRAAGTSAARCPVGACTIVTSGSARTSATRRRMARLRLRGCRPARPLSTTAISGEIVPGPSVRSSSLRPWTDGAWEGRFLARARASARGTAPAARRASRKPPVRPATSAGRRMIVSAMRAQTPPSPSGRRPISGTRSRRRLEPNIGQQRGQQRHRGEDRDERDEQAADAHRADERQRDEHEQASPIATVTPEKSTAWPAVRIVVRSASRSSAPPRAPRGSGRRRAASSRSRWRCRSA